MQLGGPQSSSVLLCWCTMLLLQAQTERQTDGTDSMNSTADAEGNKAYLKSCFQSVLHNLHIHGSSEHNI